MKCDVLLRKDLLFLDVQGVCTYATALELLKGLEGRIPDACCATVVLRNVTWQISTGDIRHLAMRVGELPRILWAVIAADSMAYGMARMFRAWIVGEERYENFGVFRDRELAETWLKARVPDCGNSMR